MRLVEAEEERRRAVSSHERWSAFRVFFAASSPREGCVAANLSLMNSASRASSFQQVRVQHR